MVNEKRTRSAVLGFAAFASAAGLVFAGPAQANPVSLTVSGTAHQINVAYTVTIHCNFRSTVAVIDNGNVLPQTPVAPDENNVAVTQWTPTTVGKHTLVAEGCMSYDQTDQPIQIEVDVTDAVPTVAAWQQNATYQVGDVVSYDGAQYRCIQAHTAYAPNWTPPNTPALWQKL